MHFGEESLNEFFSLSHRLAIYLAHYDLRQVRINAASEIEATAKFCQLRVLRFLFASGKGKLAELWRRCLIFLKMGREQLLLRLRLR